MSVENRRFLPPPRWGVPILLLWLSLPFLALAQDIPKGIYYANQHQYYLQGLRLAGEDFLQHDPDGLAPPSHPLFTYMVAGLARAGWLASGSQLLAALGLAVYGLACGVVGLGLARAWRESRAEDSPWGVAEVAAGGLTGAVFLLLLNLSPLDAIGVAGHPLVTDYFQASNISVLVLLGTGFFWWGAPRAAMLCLGLAAVVHSHWLVISAPLALLIGWEVWRGGRPRLAGGLVLAFVLLSAPAFVLGPLRFAGAHDLDTLATFNNWRNPHHAVVSVWWDAGEALKLAVIALATGLAWWRLPARVGGVLGVYALYIGGGIALAALTDAEALKMLVPWRASAFVLPLSYLVLLSVLTRRGGAVWVVGGVGLFGLVYGLVVVAWAWPGARWDYTTPEIEMTRAHTQPDDLILIPPRLDEGFRLYARRPVFVTFKAAHQHSLGDWLRRIRVAEAWLAADAAAQRDYCARYPQVAYYLLPGDAPAAEGVNPVARTAGYLLVRCPTNAILENDHSTDGG